MIFACFLMDFLSFSFVFSLSFLNFASVPNKRALKGRMFLDIDETEMLRNMLNAWMVAHSFAFISNLRGWSGRIHREGAFIPEPRGRREG